MHKVVLKITVILAIPACGRGSSIVAFVRAKGTLKCSRGGVMEITTGATVGAVAVNGAGKPEEIPVTTIGGGT